MPIQSILSYPVKLRCALGGTLKKYNLILMSLIHIWTKYFLILGKCAGSWNRLSCIQGTCNIFLIIRKNSICREHLKSLAIKIKNVSQMICLPGNAVTRSPGTPRNLRVIWNHRISQVTFILIVSNPVVVFRAGQFKARSHK